MSNHHFHFRNKFDDKIFCWSHTLELLLKKFVWLSKNTRWVTLNVKADAKHKPNEARSVVAASSIKPTTAELFPMCLLRNKSTPLSQVSSKTKNGSNHTVPLTDAAQDVASRKPTPNATIAPKSSQHETRSGYKTQINTTPHNRWLSKKYNSAKSLLRRSSRLRNCNYFASP